MNKHLEIERLIYSQLKNLIPNSNSLPDRLDKCIIYMSLTRQMRSHKTQEDNLEMSKMCVVVKEHDLRYEWTFSNNPRQIEDRLLCTVNNSLVPPLLQTGELAGVGENRGADCGL